jgi:hypothetical protein
MTNINDAVARLRNNMKKHIIGTTVAVDEKDLRTVLGRLEATEQVIDAAMARLALWRDRAFDWNNSEEFVEIDNLIGELKAMRRAYEEGK